MLERSKKYNEICERKRKVDKLIKEGNSSKIMDALLLEKSLLEEKKDTIFNIYRELFILDKVDVKEFNKVINITSYSQIENLRNENLTDEKLSNELNEFLNLYIFECSIIKKENIEDLVKILDEVFPNIDKEKFDIYVRLFKHLVRLKYQIDISKREQKYVDVYETLEENTLVKNTK